MGSLGEQGNAAVHLAFLLWLVISIGVADAVLEWSGYQVQRPPARWHHSSALDPTTGAVYVVGGVAAGLYGIGNEICLADTWELSPDGSEWRELAPAGSSAALPPHTGAALVHMSSPVPLLVLIGGNFMYPCSDETEGEEGMTTVWMHTLGDNRWKAGTAFADSEHGFPASRFVASVASVPTTSGAVRAVLAGGLSAKDGSMLGDVWELDMTRSFTSDTRGVWRMLGELPRLSAQAAAMYHPPSGTVYLHGGFLTSNDGQASGESTASLAATDQLLQLSIPAQGAAQNASVAERTGSGAARRGHTSWLAAIDGQNYLAVAGGLEPDSTAPALQLFDLDSGAWQPSTDSDGDGGESSASSRHAPPGVLRGATAVASRDSRWALILGGYKTVSAPSEGELLADSIDYRFYSEGSEPRWVQLDFTTPPPRVQGSAVMLGADVMLLQGGCTPYCDTASSSTFLSDVWTLRRPSSGDWRGLSAPGALNRWGRVHLAGLGSGSSSPGMRFYHSLVAEAAPGRGAILFGGLIPRPPLNPTFNYDVWRLDVVDDDDGVDSTGTWSRVPITGVGSSIPTSQLLINHPPVFAHTANMDSDGNMIVFGGYDGYLIQHTASHSCTLTSSIWRLKLNGSSGGGRWERLSASSSSDPGVPAPRRHHACAFLPRGSSTRGPILWCHGGLSCAGSVLADTWGFDTSAARWSPPQHATSPGARAAASLVPVSDTQLILTGGFASVETQAAVAGVWVLDAGCQPALARWREIFPASLHFRMQHSGVHLGGGVVAMVGGEVADNDGDDDGWTLATSWTAGGALHVTNSLELLDASECNLQSGEETCPATLGLCDSAPFTASLSVVVSLPLPTDPASSAADPTCVMSTDGVDVVVSEVGSGSVLRTCMSPTDSGGAESEAGCDWSGSSSGSDSALVIRGIALREASANVSVRAVYNGVVLAESAPLELGGGEDAPEQSALSLRLTAPAVLTFWLRAGNEPLPGAAVELMRCVSEDFCLPVELPADLPPACVPTTTNEFGGAEFPVWPPLTETAYGFRVRVTVDGISYWSRRIAPQSLHPGKVWGESLAIPSGITASAEVLLMLSGISGLDSTTQGIWPDVELRLLQRTTSDVVTTGTVGLQRLSTTAYDSLISSPHNSWPSVWQEGELDIDLQSEYVLHAVAEGTDGRYLLAQSTQTLSGTSTRHTLSFQLEIQYMLLKLTLVFPSCLERSVDCSREIRTIPSAVARVTTGLVTVRDADLTAPVYDAAPADPPRRALAQLNHGSFEWTHSGRSDAAGELRLGLFFSNALPEGAPQLKLQLSYGAQAIHPPITIQRRPEVNLGTVIATSPLLCVGQTISAMAGAFPVSDLMQLADPRPAVPPGHVCRYNIRPPWPSGTAGTLEIHVFHHLMSDDDGLVLMPTNSQGSVLFSITCARRGCGNENTSPYHLQVRASRMDILFQAGQAGPKAEQDVTGFMVKFAASSSSMLPSEDPSLGSGGSNNNLDGVSNRVLIEVMTAGVVSIVLLLLVVCCVWKLCWMRMRHNQMAEGALLERRSGEETFLELIGINGGTRRRNGWDNAQRGGGHADHWHQHATGEPVVRQQRRRRGVPSSVVAQLPMHKHVTEPTPEGEEAEEPDCCSICLEDYEDGVMLKVLPCTHKFHSDCIKAWLHRNTTCPLCKYVLYEPPHVEVVELMPNPLTGPPTPAESPEIPPARLVGAVNRDESEEGVDIRASDRVVGGDRPRSQPSSLSGRVGSY